MLSVTAVCAYTNQEGWSSNGSQKLRLSQVFNLNISKLYGGEEEEEKGEEGDF